MSKRQKLLLSMLLTIIVSGIITSVGIFTSSTFILVFSVLLLMSLPFTAYQLVKCNEQM